MPFEEEFDVIGAFDVLEHIEQDGAVLSEMFRAVHAGGGIMLTVPQHPFLWSRTDEHARHKRRYTRAGMIDKVRRAGFRVARATSFVSLLLPAMVMSRAAGRATRRADPLPELGIGAGMNAILTRVLAAERALIERGVSFPATGWSASCREMRSSPSWEAPSWPRPSRTGISRTGSCITSGSFHPSRSSCSSPNPFTLRRINMVEPSRGADPVTYDDFDRFLARLKDRYVLVPVASYWEEAKIPLVLYGRRFETIWEIKKAS